MKIARFELNGRTSFGFLTPRGMVPSSALEGDLPDDLQELVSSEVLTSQAFRRTMGELAKSFADPVPLEKVRLLAPLPRPGKIVCLGKNYADHVQESGTKPAQGFMIFIKPPTAVAGPYDDIVYPSVTEKLDYEGELGVVIGRRCKKVGREDALSAVLGFLVFDDVSARDLQFGDGQWTRGKGCDTFAPMGPWVTTLDELPDPNSLRLRTLVNGEVRQDANTSSLIKGVPEVVSTLSQGMTLEAGDVIATGTPAGVGAYWKPEPRLLSIGDSVRIEIEGLGHIENRVVAES